METANSWEVYQAGVEAASLPSLASRCRDSQMPNIAVVSDYTVNDILAAIIPASVLPPSLGMVP